MKLTNETKYPTRRAYVLKLRGDAGPRDLAGRLENLVTGQHRDFGSSQALLDVLACDLEAAAQEAVPDRSATNR